MSERIRSFISIDLEDKALVERLGDLQKKLVDSGADLKLVEAENMHFTLRFLGEIASSTVNALIEELKSVKFNSFQLSLQGLGAFPSLDRINVIWIGNTEGREELKQIAEKIEASVRKIGLPPDRKGFSPHLTIARVRSGRNKDKLAEILKATPDYDLGTLNVNSVRLKKSTLTSQGPIYKTIFEVKAGEEST